MCLQISSNNTICNDKDIYLGWDSLGFCFGSQVLSFNRGGYVSKYLLVSTSIHIKRGVDGFASIICSDTKNLVGTCPNITLGIKRKKEIGEGNLR